MTVACYKETDKTYFASVLQIITKKSPGQGGFFVRLFMDKTLFSFSLVLRESRSHLGLLIFTGIFKRTCFFIPCSFQI